MFLRELFEQKNKLAVIVYGRMNPPTLGHKKLVNTLTATALQKKGTPILFLSHTQDSKSNPLTFQQKKSYAQKVFPNIAIAPEFSSKTFIAALQYLESNGFDEVIHLVGSDRLNNFQKIIDNYNGKTDKFGNIPFTFKNYSFIDLERDPDSADIDGISASKVREFVANDDFQAFSRAVPGTDSDKASLYSDLQDILVK